MDSAAAIFDFDGVIFQPDAKWKVQNPHFGRSGSRVNWSDACIMFESLLEKNPGARLSDNFVLNEGQYIPIDPEKGENFLPLDSLWKTARNHLSKSHSLYFLSCRSYKDLYEVTNAFLEKDPRSREIENPFEKANHLSPIEKADASTDGNLDKKMNLLSQMLKDPANPAGTTFTKLFLYCTEPGYRPRVQKFLEENRDELEGGRNAIVSMVIGALR